MRHTYINQPCIFSNRLNISCFFRLPVFLFVFSAFQSCHTPTETHVKNVIPSNSTIETTHQLLQSTEPISKEKLDSITNGIKALEGPQTKALNMALLYRDLGWRYYNKSNYSTAYWAFQKSIEMAEAKNDSIELGFSHLALATLFHQLNEYEDALHYSELALKIAQAIQHLPLLHEALTSLANSEFELKNYQIARSYAENAIQRFRNHQTLPIFQFHNLIGLIYQELNNIEAAKQSFFTALETAEKTPEKEKGFIYGNIGFAFWQLGQIDSANHYLNLDVALSMQNKSYQSAYNALITLLEITLSQGNSNEQKLISLLTQAASLFNHLNFANKSNYLQTHLKAINSLPAARRIDFLAPLTQKIISDFTSYQNASYQNQTVIQMLTNTIFSLENEKAQTVAIKKTRSYLYTLIVIMSIILMGGILFIKIQQRNNKRKNHKTMLDLQSLKNENNSLLLAINYKNEEIHELSAAHNNLLEARTASQAKSDQEQRVQQYMLTIKQKTIDNLASLYKELPTNTDKLKHHVQMALKELEQLEEVGNYLNLSQNALGHSFEEKLLQIYPSLSSDDAKLLTYIKMNFSTSEIARIKSITIAGVNKGRNRLRKKLGIDPNTDLRDFLNSL
jgi:hypothetical protein